MFHVKFLLIFFNGPAILYVTLLVKKKVAL